MVPLRPAVLLLLPLLAQTQVPVERELTMPDGDVRRYLLQLPPGYQKSEAGAVVIANRSTICPLLMSDGALPASTPVGEDAQGAAQTREAAE